jgi:hypothetical protein
MSEVNHELTVEYIPKKSERPLLNKIPKEQYQAVVNRLRRRNLVVAAFNSSI